MENDTSLIDKIIDDSTGMEKAYQKLSSIIPNIIKLISVNVSIDEILESIKPTIVATAQNLIESGYTLSETNKFMNDAVLIIQHEWIHERYRKSQQMARSV